MTSTPGAVTRQVVEQVKALRQDRRWSAQRLASEMVKVGIPWRTGVINKLETDRRDAITVDELVALATVLEVSPLTLLSDEPVQSRRDELADEVAELRRVVESHGRQLAALRGEQP